MPVKSLRLHLVHSGRAPHSQHSCATSRGPGPGKISAESPAPTVTVAIAPLAVRSMIVLASRLVAARCFFSCDLELFPPASRIIRVRPRPCSLPRLGFRASLNFRTTSAELPAMSPSRIPSSSSSAFISFASSNFPCSTRLMGLRVRLNCRARECAVTPALLPPGEIITPVEKALSWLVAPR